MPNMDEIEFFYKKFFFNKNVLVPRFETEILVREAINIIKKNKIKTLIDIGTWSWIIPISIDLNTDIDQIFAIEKSKKALKIAKINKEKLWSKTSFLEGDLLKIFIQDWLKNFSWQILITANLPYIKQNDWENMSSDTRFEPKMALFWWKDTGFELYEKFFRQIIIFKKIYNQQLFILCEIWFDQKEVATKFLTKNGFCFSFIKDLSGVDRILEIIF